MVVSSSIVAANVLKELVRQDRSRSWLARRLGRPAEWLSRRFRGEVEFSVDDVAAIAAVLAVAFSDLTGIGESTRSFAASA